MSEHHHSHHHHHHHSRHGSTHRRRSGAELRRMQGLIAIIALIVLAVGGLVVSSIGEQRQEEKRTAIVDQRDILPTLTYNSNTYRMRSNLLPVLLIGYDKYDNEQSGFRNGGQADFLLLMVIDHANKQVFRLHLDRDSMTEVKVLGMTGREVGTSVMQVCLSHAFGSTQKENNQYTMDAVSNMLAGVPIDFYASMNLGNLEQINHILGGVTVTIEDDFSQYDEQMIPGARITLTDQQADLFLHSRMTIGDGTNMSRMRRHRAYMAGAFDTIQTNLRADSGYASKLLDLTNNVIETNMPRGRIVNELNKAASYQILPFDMLEGEHTYGAREYAEFYVDEDSIMEWVLRAYYEPVE